MCLDNALSKKATVTTNMINLPFNASLLRHRFSITESKTFIPFRLQNLACCELVLVRDMARLRHLKEIKTKGDK